MAPTAAIRRGSFCNDSSVWVGSVDIFFSDADVTSLPAIRTIVQSVHAKANIVLRLAEAAILVAGALRLGLVALRADDGHPKRSPCPTHKAISLHTKTGCHARQAALPFPVAGTTGASGFPAFGFSAGANWVELHRPAGFLTLQNTHARFVSSLQT